MPATILLILLINALPSAPPEQVRIGLFRLFNPTTVVIRPGGQAAVRSQGPVGAALDQIGVDRTLLLRCQGNAVDGIVSDSAGRHLHSIHAATISILPTAGTFLEITIPGEISRRVSGELVVSVETNEGQGGSRIRLVLGTDLESAVRAIVAAELKGTAEEEARKALEVLCRSYLVAHRGRHSSEGFDFCDTTHCQLYQGDDVNQERTATPDEILSFQDRVVEGYYTAACGGRTLRPADVWGGKETSRYPFRGIACSWCRRSEHWRWRRSAGAARVFDAVSKALGERLSSKAQLILEKENGSALVKSVEVRDGGKRFHLSGDAFKRAIGKSLGWNTVLSPSFSVRRRGHLLVFEGRGFGSQVGLCVAGARAQAAAGRSYREILSFYYPGASIKESRIIGGDE